MAEPQLQFTIPRPNTPVLKPNGQMRDEWFNFLVAITTNVIAAGGTVTHTGALVLNRLVVGNGLDDIRAVAGADGQIPIAATSDGTVQFQNITGTLPVVVTNSPHGIAISAPTSVTGAAGANTDIQYNDAGAFGGDANLTWDKTKQTETITGTDQESTLLIKVAGQPTANLGGNELGLSLGTHETGGVEIAEIANIGYFAFEPGGVATMGLSVGETPGSPTTYANYTEWDVTDRTAELTGDPAAGAIPGLAIGAQANQSGSGAASTIFGEQRGGTRWYVWQDATGAMRYGPARPTEDNSVSDTSGSLFGSGSGSGSTLNVFARRGDDGRMGMPGSIGPQGPQGAIGPTGPAGNGGVSMPFPRQDDRTRVVMIGSPSTSTPATSNPEVPIVVTTNSLVDTNFCWVVSESLEIAGGISLEIAGGARVEITGPTYVQIGARLNNSSNQSLTSGVAAALTFDTETYDFGNLHGSINPTRLTAPVAGIYQIFGTCSFASNASGERRLQLFLNGTSNICIIDQPANGASGLTTNISISAAYFLSNGDYIELFARQDSGGSLNSQTSIPANPTFGMTLVQ